MQKPALGEEIIQETKKVLSDIWNGFENTINGGVYDILSSDEVYELQKNANKYPIMKNIGHALLPDAVDTYIGNLTRGKNYEEENDNHPKNLSKIAQVTKVSKLQNKEIKDFIYRTYKRIKSDNPLVVLNSHSEASKRLKKSKYTQKVLKENWNSIKNGDYKNKILGINYNKYTIPLKYINPEYYKNQNMKAAYSKLSIFNPHIDTNNNLVMYAIDYDDYEESKSKAGALDAINDNAYKLQENGIVEPYLKIIELKFTPEELSFIIDN